MTAPYRVTVPASLTPLLVGCAGYDSLAIIGRCIFLAMIARRVAIQAIAANGIAILNRDQIRFQGIIAAIITGSIERCAFRTMGRVLTLNLTTWNDRHIATLTKGKW